jgi:hypothetical protein
VMLVTLECEPVLRSEMVAISGHRPTYMGNRLPVLNRSPRKAITGCGRLGCAEKREEARSVDLKSERALKG